MVSPWTPGSFCHHNCTCSTNRLQSVHVWTPTPPYLDELNTFLTLWALRLSCRGRRAEPRDDVKGSGIFFIDGQKVIICPPPHPPNVFPRLCLWDSQTENNFKWQRWLFPSQMWSQGVFYSQLETWAEKHGNSTGQTSILTLPFEFKIYTPRHTEAPLPQPHPMIDQRRRVCGWMSVCERKWMGDWHSFHIKPPIWISKS